MQSGGKPLNIGHGRSSSH